MSAKERGSQDSLGSDLERIDAHVITPAEYDETPELGEEFFERAKLHEGGRPLASSKQEVTLAIDRDVLERFRATGADWPNRVNDVLRKAAKHLV
ncbi:MAG: BrnA antitoxin family protein [Methylobacteriaceae bacterium]|nr:BrnA antitoxin family protein [Methylobacteriaceae bacterium]